MAEINCRHFSGYKPCGLSLECHDQCPQRDLPQVQILIVHLEALGAVLRATSLLPAIKRKFPSSQITWVTQAPAQQLLAGNPYVDRILTTERDDLLTLEALEFDIGFCVDKSLKAVGVVRRTVVDMLYGFTVEARAGAILPATAAARELWELGLSNQKKFYDNQKSEVQLMNEALELGPFRRDAYQLHLFPSEHEEIRRRSQQWSNQGRHVVIGLNTGCSSTIPYKKLSVLKHRQLISKILELNLGRIVLLGGPEDAQRNREIAQDLPVECSPTQGGLRDGLCSVAACDLVVSGDSLGLHMAIALKKWSVAWFGPTCAQEIDLYGRGEKVLSPASCGPCWKRFCSQPSMCYDLVSVNELVMALQKGLKWLKESSSSKPHLLETSS